MTRLPHKQLQSKQNCKHVKGVKEKGTGHRPTLRGEGRKTKDGAPKPVETSLLDYVGTAKT